MCVLGKKSVSFSSLPPVDPNASCRDSYSEVASPPVTPVPTVVRPQWLKDQLSARRVVQMGLVMQQVVQRKAASLGVDIGVRIGVHTGPVIGGIIGTVRNSSARRHARTGPPCASRPQSDRGMPHHPTRRVHRCASISTCGASVSRAPCEWKRTAQRAGSTYPTPRRHISRAQSLVRSPTERTPPRRLGSRARVSSR